MIIFDSQKLGEAIPPQYNAVKIPLNGKMQSDLNWNKTKQMALECKEKGFRIFWEMDLGLFDRLTLPLANQTQYLSLCLSMEHFRDTLWKEFQEESFGVSLYRGSADFQINFPWDAEQVKNFQGWLQESFKDVNELREEANIHVHDFSSVHPLMLSNHPQGLYLISLFCRDVAGEYLDLIASRLPAHLPCYLILDVSSIDNPVLLAQLLTKERYPHLHLAIQRKGTHERQLAFHQDEEDAKLGICLPAMSFHRPSDYENLQEVFHFLQCSSLPYRVIPESMLTNEWDGLDYLFVVSRSLSSQGRRKLQGFCAAGGTVITLGSEIGLVQETNFEEWRDLQKIC